MQTHLQPDCAGDKFNTNSSDSPFGYLNIMAKYLFNQLLELIGRNPGGIMKYGELLGRFYESFERRRILQSGIKELKV